jgi:hypothetical protein
VAFPPLGSYLLWPVWPALLIGYRLNLSRLLTVSDVGG